MSDRRKRKRKTGERVVPPPQPTLEEIVKKVAATFNEINQDSVRLISDAEYRAAYYQRELERLEGRLVRLLSADQIEAAKISGCPPAVYAIEWIDIWREKMFPRDGVINATSFDFRRGNG